MKRSYPSSEARNLVAEPELLEINVMLPMGMRVCSKRCAVMIGPIVFVHR